MYMEAQAFDIAKIKAVKVNLESPTIFKINTMYFLFSIVPLTHLNLVSLSIHFCLISSVK